jgi:hypothetical protein
MSEPGAYERVRGQFLDALAGLPPDALATTVPATPAWTLRDVVAHLVGLAADLNAQRFPTDDDPTGDAWGAAQVNRRRHLDLAALRTEWDIEGPTFDAGLQLFGRETECHFVGDLVTHVLDAAEALRIDIPVDPTAVDMAVEHYTSFVAERLDALGRTMPAAVLDLPPRRRLRLLSARVPLSAVPGAEALADVYDGTPYTFPPG